MKLKALPILPIIAAAAEVLLLLLLLANEGEKLLSVEWRFPDELGSVDKPPFPTPWFFCDECIG